MFPELAVQPDRLVELPGDLSEAHVNVIHARFMKGYAFSLHLLHFRLTALDFSHDDQRVLNLDGRLLEVHSLQLYRTPEFRTSLKEAAEKLPPTSPR